MLNLKLQETIASTVPTAAQKPSFDDTTYETTDAGEYDEAAYDDYDEESELPKSTTTSAAVCVKNRNCVRFRWTRFN